jgi:acylphosphatase
VDGVSSDATGNARWEVVGRVQGVGFRWFVREQARRWGLAGWVRNREDGAVEIAAFGPHDSIAGLRSAVRRGPPGAFVTEVRDLEPTPTEYPNPFSILRD